MLAEAKSLISHAKRTLVQAERKIPLSAPQALLSISLLQAKRSHQSAQISLTVDFNDPGAG